MRITDVEVLPISCPIDEPLQDASFAHHVRNEVIIRVHTDEGITGIGEACQFYVTNITRVIVEEGLKPIILGEDPFNVEKIWDKMYSRTFLYGRKGATIIAISGVEIALWDIIGKATGLPVYKLLGGDCEDKIRAYASGGFLQPKENLVKEMIRHVENGFTAVKMKIGFDPKKDVEKVKAVRTAIGEDVDLIVDANMGYTPAVALKVAGNLKEFDVLFFEEPTSADDVEGLAKVTAGSYIQTAAGENEYTIYGFKDIISRRAVDIIQPDATRTGGILQAKKIASMANAANMPCAPHIFGSTVGLVAHLHLVASIPNSYLLEFDQTPNQLRRELLMEPIEAKKGYVEVPKKPGLGIELNEKTLKKYLIR